MRVIYTTDLSRHGNDCYIYETVSLIEDNGIYNTILTTKVTGWFDDMSMTLGNPTEDFHEAVKSYKFAGGRMS